MVRNHISENNTIGSTIGEMIKSIDEKISKISNDLLLQFHSLVRSYGYAIEEEKSFQALNIFIWKGFL